MKTSKGFIPSEYGDVPDELKRREPSTPHEAAIFIKDIRKQKGCVDEELREELQKLTECSRITVEDWRKGRRDREAAFTRSISEGLYSTKYRFLYELVQNAQDLRYQEAQARGDAALLRFTVTPEKITVETNEDGFTKENVTAICETGKSSKKASVADDHVGEKGYGFKSVFSVSEKVHIQSGHWSFCFKHRQGDDGLGMVTPLDAPLETLGADVTTRITLHLSKSARTTYQKLLDAISEIPATTIIFLSKLQRIHFRITTLDGSTTRRFITKQPGSAQNVVTIEESDSGRKPRKVGRLYHCVSHEILDMPKEHRRHSRSRTTVQLAFPVDELTKQPLLDPIGQHIFAYLPLHRLSKLPFLIQADFIVLANREQIETDCAWNMVIQSGIAAAFAKAVSTFVASDHPLRHSWLDYLPVAQMSSPWTDLYGSIKRVLKDMPILRTREHFILKAPKLLRHVPNSALHKNEPILADLSEELYLSSEYAAHHEQALSDLGVTALSLHDLVELLKVETTKLSSKLKCKRRDDPWHESFAELLLHAMSTNHSDKAMSNLKRLPIIPLVRPNQWTGAPGQSKGGREHVYFSYTDKIPIPESLSTDLLDRDASRNPRRKAFYTALGVEEWAKHSVLAKIQDAHRGSIRLPTFGVPQFAELRYLFYHHDKPDELRAWVELPTEQLDTAKATKRWYFPSEDEYSMHQLIPARVRPEIRKDAVFLPQGLMSFVSPGVEVRDKTWTSWLQELTEARYIPMLTKRTNGVLSISTGLAAVLEHNPSKFLGTLKAHWKTYQATAGGICDEFGMCKVPCQGGTSRELNKTYLPTVKILHYLKEFNLPETTVPILQLPGAPLEKTARHEWGFLELFQVRSEPDLSLFKCALGALRRLQDQSQVSTYAVTKVYHCLAGLAKTDDFEKLRAFIKKKMLMWIPSTNSWTDLEQSIWRGPEFLQHTVVLEKEYKSDPVLKNFFAMVLGIHDADSSHVLRDLELCSEYAEEIDVELAQQYYEYLDANVVGEENWKTIRSQIEEDWLMVVEGEDCYCQLSKCLWNSPFTLTGYHDLAEIYPTLEDLFTKHLMVKNITPRMLVNEIVRMATLKKPKIRSIKERLIGVGLMFAKAGISEEDESALEALSKVKFLPKKVADGTSVLVAITDEFAIPDHQRYYDALEAHNVLLDFEVADVQILHVLFETLGLEDRYLSMAVKEISTTGIDCIQDSTLSRQLREKAYALYCCAAKHKSTNALRDDRELFVRLSNITIYTATNISTNLVLTLDKTPLSVQSDRYYIHSDFRDRFPKIYVPANLRQQQECYRSQLPKLLIELMKVDSSATFDVSEIIRSRIRDLEDVLVAQDITPVSWIEKPVVELAEDADDATSDDDSPATTRSDSTSSFARSRQRNNFHREQNGYESPPTTPSQFGNFVDQVVEYAQQAHGIYESGDDTSSHDEEHEEFDHKDVFGSREINAFAHDRRIGAAGEAYVFERLSNLGLPDFDESNWRSTIRGELSKSEHFADLQNWVGRETADIVYEDTSGQLAEFLGAVCVEPFPARLEGNLKHKKGPFKYYLEVKTTTGECDSRFFMSGAQYKRMHKMDPGNCFSPSHKPTSDVYVIIRVYDLLSSEIGMNIYVDPLQFDGSHLAFKTDQWTVTAT